jgi:ABC-type sugar transport system permease subunit
MLKVVGWLGPGQWYYWSWRHDAVMIAIITIHVWRMPPFSTRDPALPGLGSIPPEVHEAADTDGAGPLAKAFR